MSADMITSFGDGRPRTPNATRAAKPGDYGSTAAAADLGRLLRKLRASEDTAVYREMSAAATARRAAHPGMVSNANGMVAGHGSAGYERGCRCDVCGAAARERRRRYRDRKRSEAQAKPAWDYR